MIHCATPFKDNKNNVKVPNVSKFKIILNFRE